MLRFRLLGPLEVLDDAGAPVDVGGRQSRVLLAVLLAAGGRSVTVDIIADAIWGVEIPPSATGTLQSYVSRLRRRFGGEAALVWDERGYRLQADPAQVDFRLFEQLVDQGQTQLEAGRPEEARARLLEAEALWRGPALAEFADLDFATGLATRLEQRRLASAESRLAAELQLGRHAAVVAELTELVAAYPLREGLQAQLALALYRSGRQAEALRAIAEASTTLREELGIEPSRELRRLEDDILAHAPSLDLPAGRGTPAPPLSPFRSRPASATPSEPSAATRRARLVGREAELLQLLAALDESSEDSRFVVIEGEPGIGKTRLADELRAVALERGALAVWGRSDEGGAAPALWPWLPPLRALADAAGAHPAAFAELLVGEAPVFAGQAQATRFERFQAVADVFESVAASRPVVVLLDDLQWADETSLELLGFLAGRLGRGTLVVGTLRQLEVGRADAVTDALATVARRPGSRRLVVRGLSEDETAAVLEAATDRSVAPPVAAAIHSRAEGNPFYAIELSRLLDDESAAESVPGSVGDVIRRRLARLPKATVELLGVAAVAGRDVELNLMSRAVGQTLDAVFDDIEPAVIQRLLVEVPEHPGKLRFSHALVRQVVLDDMTSLRRARLHLRVADAIEAGGAGVDEAEILAEHLWRAAPVGVGGRAAGALERAAEVSLRRVSYAAAEDLLSKAVQLRRATSSSPADQEAELLTICRLLEVARARRYFQGATNLNLIDRAKDLAEACGRRDLLLDMLWFEWSALATSCRGQEAAPLARGLLELTSQDPRDAVRAIGHEVYAVSCWGRGRISEALEHFDAAMGLLAGAPPPANAFEAEQRMVSRTFWLFHEAVSAERPAPEIFAEFDELIASVRPDRFAVTSICGFAATTAIALGYWDDADHFASVSTDADPESQFAFWGGQVLMQRGIVEAWKGRGDEALAFFAEGQQRYTAIGARSGLSTFEASLALNLAARAGRPAEASQRVADARQELDAYGELWNEPVVLIAEAVVAHAGGDHEAAAQRLKECVLRATEQGSHAIADRARTVAAELGVVPA